MASKGPVTIVGGETVEAAIKAIKGARTKGLTVPQLAEALGVGQSTVDNHVRRLVQAGLVECRHGTAEDMGGRAGRPPNRYTWAGRGVALVTLQAFWDSQKSEATKAKEKPARKAKAAKAPKAKAKPEAPAGRKALTVEQKAAKAAKDKARREAKALDPKALAA